MASQARVGAVRELTIRSIALGGAITLVFTAANVYLGLRVGLTFATSIPELMVNATFADAEHSNYTKAGVADLITAARSAG